MPSQPLQVVFTADPYGYGPASKAKTVAEYLRRSDVDVSLRYFAEGTALDFGELNSEVYDELVDIEDRDVYTCIEESDADLLISVMEPEPVIAAHIQGIPTITVDELFWFWEFSDPLAVVEEIRDRQSDSASLRTYFDELTGNDLDLAAHAVADQSFLQVYPSETQRGEVTDTVGDVTVVNPIVDTGAYDPDGERDCIIVSLCGQLNPAVTREKAVRYAEAVLSILSPKLDCLDEHGFEPIVAGHPDVVADLNTRFRATTLEHSEWLSTLNRAVGLLCPPSIGSVYEAVMYDVPVFFIPEQHPGHWPEFDRLSSAGDDNSFPGVVLGEEFDALTNLTKQDQDKKQGFEQVERDAEKILDAVERVAEWDSSDLRAAFPDYERLGRLPVAGFREEVLTDQREAILDDESESANGGERIADAAISLRRQG